MDANIVKFQHSPFHFVVFAGSRAGKASEDEKLGVSF